MEKFNALNDEGLPIPFGYGDLFFRQPCEDAERLVIGPSADHVALIASLAQGFRTQSFSVLYVLLVSHAGHVPGRYQSPPFESFAALEQFLHGFRSFFEGDGRHHLSVAGSGEDLLVYDQHNVIFAYGRLEEFQRRIEARGFREQRFWFPAPHAHTYPAENAEQERELMAYLAWEWSPLQRADEWK